jgi:hypothetical protein
MYGVEWLSAAVLPVANALNTANETLRAAIRQAVTEVGIQLRNDPNSKGESRSGGRRILFVALLGILFRVDLRPQSVLVVRAWIIRQGRQHGQ